MIFSILVYGAARKKILGAGKLGMKGLEYYLILNLFFPTIAIWQQFNILLCLTPDSFTCQREARGNLRKEGL